MEKRKPGGPCFIEPYLGSPDQLKRFEHTKAFFILNKLALTYILSFFSKAAKQKIAFESAFLNHEILHAHLISSFLETDLKGKLHNK